MLEGRARLEYHNSWVTAVCDQGTLEYYRWWFWKVNHIWLMRPKYGAHISVIRDRDKKDFLFSHSRQNLNITFSYNNLLEHHSDGYVWMPVWGKELEDVREECGLSRKPTMPFHMTVGRSDLL